MQTFTQEKKTLLLAEIDRHREADQIIQGTYGKGSGKNWKGCAVGCAIHSLNKISKKRFSTSNHKVYETELGIPEAIAYLADTIFEGLTPELSKSWPSRFIAAVNPGADLSLVLPKFYLKILLDKDHGVKQWALDDGKQVIDMVASVHENHIKTGTIDEAARSAAESAAWSAAESAAWSAARSAESAARSAAWSAARSAESAARSAAWSAARSAAWSAHYEWLADVLVEILEETK